MKHHRALIALHWSMALLVLTALAIALARETIEDGEARRFWLDVHRSIGLLVLVLLIVRILVRLAWARGTANTLAPALRLASNLSHGALYAAMFAVPLLGWAQSSARTEHFRLFGIALPSLVAHDADLADILGEWHSRVSWIFLTLAGMHAAAALWHHYARRDNVLRSMLP